MADIRAHPEQDQEHEGASPAELVIEACRRNNTELLAEVIEGCANPEAVALLLNETKTAMGNYVYHEAALRGNYLIIDMLLDQEGFECDPINRIEGDTPLHSAVRWINEQPESAREYGQQLIEMMLEAGSDPRIRNKAHLTPHTLVDPSNTALRTLLEDAIDIAQNAGDFVEDDDPSDDDIVTGSASDSDFDIEEFKREKERRDKERKELKVQANGAKST